MNFKNTIDIVYSFCIFMFSLFVKNKDDMWLFGSQGGNNYSDNSKYFFEWILANQSEDCYWVTKKKCVYKKLLSDGLPVIYFYDIKKVLLLAKAKYIICTHSHIGNDVYKFINKNKTLITLWHGIPLKKMGESAERKYLKHFNIKSQPDLFLVTNPTDADLFSNLYKIDRNKFFIGTYPRVNDLISIANDKKTILYAPTFRDNMTQGYYDEYIFPTLEELKNLNNVLIKFGYNFFVKMHPYVQADFPELSGFSNIQLVSPFDDVQEYLAQAKVLITDYSSIYFDYLNLDRNVVFFIPDYEWYNQTSNRGLLYEYEDVTPGIKVFSWAELQNNLNRMLSRNITIDFSTERKHVLEFFYTEQSVRNYELYKKCKQI